MSKTQPGKRMRKLLSGSQENDAAMNDQAGAAKDADAAKDAGPSDAANAANDAGAAKDAGAADGDPGANTQVIPVDRSQRPSAGRPERTAAPVQPEALAQQAAPAQPAMLALPAAPVLPAALALRIRLPGPPRLGIRGRFRPIRRAGLRPRSRMRQPAPQYRTNAGEPARTPLTGPILYPAHGAFFPAAAVARSTTADCQRQRAAAAPGRTGRSKRHAGHARGISAAGQRPLHPQPPAAGRPAAWRPTPA